MNNEAFSLKNIALPAFGPSLLYGVGTGAIVPVIALSAHELGASLALSGLIAALVGIGSLLSNVPAALIAARYGERRAMMGAALFSMLALTLCALSREVWMLACGILMVGMAGSVFLLARQTYLTEAVPVYLRARAMSLLGGTTRIGVFLGPFAGAAAIHYLDLPGAYWVACAAMFGAGAIAFALPDLVAPAKSTSQRPAAPTIRGVVRSHASVFLTLGVGIMLVSAVRASRQVVIPLWAAHLGMEAAVISLIYGLVAAIDMSVFYPAGKIMDHHGRLWVALPSTLLMGAALLSMPLTGVPASFILVSLVLGFGNGIGSGIVMTLAADAAPAGARMQFLGVWRLLSDMGSSGGPALLAAVTALVSLAMGIATIGVLGILAAAIFWRWIPERPAGQR